MNSRTEIRRKASMRSKKTILCPKNHLCEIDPAGEGTFECEQCNLEYRAAKGDFNKADSVKENG